MAACWLSKVWNTPANPAIWNTTLICSLSPHSATRSGPPSRLTAIIRMRMPALVIMSSLLKSIAKAFEPPISSTRTCFSNSADDFVSRNPRTRTMASVSSLVTSTSMATILPSASADADDDDGDVVGSAPIVGEIDERIARPLRIRIAPDHVIEQFVVGGDAVQSVRAQQQPIADTHRQLAGVDLKVVLEPGHRARHHVAHRVPPGFRAVDRSVAHLLGDPRMILGELF